LVILLPIIQNTPPLHSQPPPHWSFLFVFLFRVGSVVYDWVSCYPQAPLAPTPTLPPPHPPPSPPPPPPPPPPHLISPLSRRWVFLFCLLSVFWFKNLCSVKPPFFFFCFFPPSGAFWGCPVEQPKTTQKKTNNFYTAVWGGGGGPHPPYPPRLPLPSLPSQPSKPPGGWCFFCRSVGGWCFVLIFPFFLPFRLSSSGCVFFDSWWVGGCGGFCFLPPPLFLVSVLCCAPPLLWSWVLVLAGPAKQTPPHPVGQPTVKGGEVFFDH